MVYKTENLLNINLSGSFNISVCSTDILKSSKSRKVNIDLIDSVTAVLGHLTSILCFLPCGGIREYWKLVLGGKLRRKKYGAVFIQCIFIPFVSCIENSIW